MDTDISGEQYWIDGFRFRSIETRRQFIKKYGVEVFENYLQLQLKMGSDERALLFAIRLADTIKELTHFALTNCRGFCGGNDEYRRNEEHFYGALGTLFQVMKPCDECDKVIAERCCILHAEDELPF